MCDGPPSHEPQRLVVWARHIISSGDVSGAAACLDLALLAAPTLAEAHYWRGGTLVAAGDSAAAAFHFRRALQFAPAHADSYFELGNTQYAARELADAEQSYLSALRVGPRHVLPHLNLGNVRTERGARARAERSYRRALDISPGGWDGCAAANGLGNLLEAEGRVQEVEHVAREALDHATGCHYARHNLARSLRRREAFEEAAYHARMALAAAPAQLEYQSNLGSVLHASGAYAEACAVYRDALRSTSAGDWVLRVDLANALQQAGQPAESLHEFATALPLQLAEAAVQLSPATVKPAEPSAAALNSASASQRKGRVVFYCRLRAHASASSAAEDIWGPSTLRSRGLGGSEEAVIFVSRQLAKLGWAVSVYANPPPEDLGVTDHGVVWKPWHELPLHGSMAAVDVLVSWRNLEGALLLPSAAHIRRYVWLQDIVENPVAYHADFVAKLSGVLVLSHFHRRGLPPLAQPKAVLTSNGIDSAHLVPPGPNRHWRFMYAAWPTAGLQPLLERWESIRAALMASPLARSHAAEVGRPELAVYYGFPRWLELMYGGNDWYRGWKRHMEALLQQEGVIYHGMVDHHTIAKAYAASGFYLFPSDKPETSGVNLMKAQAMGAFPVTSRHPNSSMPEVCGEHDLGPAVPEGAVAIQSDSRWLDAWQTSLLEAATTPPSKFVVKRSRMVERVRLDMLP